MDDDNDFDPETRAIAWSHIIPILICFWAIVILIILIATGVLKP